ncbi:MAG: hypothetical protein QG667_1503 [Pseudomonadota bacterium]|nr:hypothetical protein [Pseudomonadota bacterium]
MQRLTPIAAAFALALSGAAAADTQDNAVLREEIRALQQRLEALEQTSASTQPAVPASATGPASGFNPSVALVLSGTYANLSQDPQTYRLQGFLPSGDEVGPGSRSFSLGESELTLSANADHWFKGTLTLAATAENEVEVEEAKLETLALPGGSNLVAGRFLSGIGYLNAEHSHSWQFVDLPLLYQAFYGGQYKNDGVQLRWLAPTSLYLELAAELGNGAAYPGSESSQNGAGSAAGFIRLGDDIGHDLSWQTHLWYQQSKVAQRTYTDVNSADVEVDNSFSGRSRSWGVAAVGKWRPFGDSLRQLKVQGEWLRRSESGEMQYDNAAAVSGPLSGAYDSRQSGWYLQASYRWQRNWQASLRYDQLDSGTQHIGLVEDGKLSHDDFSMLSAYRPTRSTLAIDYLPSEFSRVRLQYSRDDSQPQRIDQQWFLNYTLSLGAHGAHGF